MALVTWTPGATGVDVAGLRLLLRLLLRMPSPSLSPMIPIIVVVPFRGSVSYEHRKPAQVVGTGVAAAFTGGTCFMLARRKIF
eukprot:m.30750 g.30750  ORF g.30750 m.30750 type:complete len:83 (+) comp6835_c0_seq1:756-1004(+)